MQRKYDIELCDSAFEPGSNSKNTLFKESGKRNLYKVWLYLDGMDLPYVESVTYFLHSSFPKPRTRIQRTPNNPNCSLIIWTWGIFTVKGTVTLKDGSKLDVSHQLTYNISFKDKDVKFIPFDK